jgi:tetratricopeptide (TPR) repeat protein
VRSLGPADRGLFEPGQEQQWKLVQPLPQREAFSDSLPARRGDLYSGLLEKMPPEQVAIFETSALIDGEIPVEVLERLHEDADVLDDALDRFETDGFGEAVDTDLTIYRFRTETARDAVLEHFENSGRRAAMRRRRQLAGALVDLYGEESDHSGSIGKLYLAGGQAQQSVSFLIHAFNRRFDQGRFVEALTFHHLVQQSQEAEAEISSESVALYRINLAYTLQKLGDPAAAENELKKLNPPAGSKDQIKAGLASFYIHFRSGDYPKCQQVLEEIEPAVESLGDHEFELSFRADLSSLLKRRGSLEEALRESDRELDLARKGDSSYQLARGLANRGGMLMELQKFETATNCYEEAIALFKEMGRLDYELIARVGVASIQYFNGHLDEAGQTFRTAIEGFRLLQNRHALSRNYFNLANVSMLLGKFDLALDSVNRSIEVRREIGDQAGLATALLYAISIHASMGDWDQAIFATESAAEVIAHLEIPKLKQECSIREKLNQLSLGKTVSLSEISELDPGVDAHAETRGLWFTLLCRAHQVAGQSLDDQTVDEIEEMLKGLTGVHLSPPRCLLAASVAGVIQDCDRAIRILESILDMEEIPPGAPLDMVLSARALLEPVDSSEREEWEARAMEAVEERAKLIERPADRRRFLKARLRRLEE